MKRSGDFVSYEEKAPDLLIFCSKIPSRAEQIPMSSPQGRWDAGLALASKTISPWAASVPLRAGIDVDAVLRASVLKRQGTGDEEVRRILSKEFLLLSYPPVCQELYLRAIVPPC
jgi:hypothetical protein